MSFQQHSSFVLDSTRLFSFTPKLLALILSGLYASNVAAQAIPTPGTVLETVRPDKPVAPSPRIGEAITVPAPSAVRNLDPNAPRTPIKEFRIAGNSVIDTATLQGLIADYAGKPYNLYDLDKVTRVISDYYHSKGYPVARAVIPAQKIDSGSLLIEVIEGKVDQVQFRGNKRYSKEFLARWGQPLVDKQVQVDELEERMLTIDDLPGVSARAVLMPGSEYGTTTTDVSIEEDPIEGQISFNNHGRKEVGEHRVDASINLNNPLQIGDQLGFRASYSEQGLIEMFGINYSLPVNVYGTRLAASYTAVDYGIGGDLADLDINGKSKLGSITLVHPFLRRQNQNLFGTFGFRYFSGEQFTSDLPISKNSIVVAEAGLAWNRIDENFNVTSAGLRVSTNFRTDADGERDTSQRFKIDGEVSQLFRLTKVWDLKLAAAGQLSSTSLADAEKFSLGGPNSVRGYPSADVRGDRGAFGSIEARYRSDAIGVPSYFSVFFDGGYTARKTPGPGTRGSNTISSVGVGFNFFPHKSLVAEIAAAVPTSGLDTSDEHDDGRVWFNLTARF